MSDQEFDDDTEKVLELYFQSRQKAKDKMNKNIFDREKDKLIKNWFIERDFNFITKVDKETRCGADCSLSGMIQIIDNQRLLFGCFRHGIHECNTSGTCGYVNVSFDGVVVCTISGIEIDRYIESRREGFIKKTNNKRQVDNDENGEYDLSQYLNEDETEECDLESADKILSEMFDTEFTKSECDFPEPCFISNSQKKKKRKLVQNVRHYKPIDMTNSKSIIRYVNKIFVI